MTPRRWGDEDEHRQSVPSILLQGVAVYLVIAAIIVGLYFLLGGAR